MLVYHTTRLDNLLLSNGLERIKIKPDGNCFLNAIIESTRDQETTAEALRIKVVEHLRVEKAHYRNFLSYLENLTDDEKDKLYDEYLSDLSQDGHWNIQLADCLPLAVANLYKRQLRVYSSRIANSVYDIVPDLSENMPAVEPIKVALFSVFGQEHYDAVKPIEHEQNTPSRKESTLSPQDNRTPKTAHHRNIIVTPRKRAQYKSPVKKQLFRKKSKHPENWTRNKRKFQRLHGKADVGQTGTN